MENFSITFVNWLSISIHWKSNTDNSILIIINRLTIIVHSKLLMVIIDTLKLIELIIHIIVRHYGFFDSIRIHYDSVFNSKFWSLPCYFLKIKLKFLTTFYPKTDDQTKRQKSTLKAYFQAFVNFAQDNWTRLLSMAELAHNNLKNTCICYKLFKLNYDYHLCAF